MRKYVWVIYLITLFDAYAQQLDSTYVRQYRNNIIINPWIGVPQYDLKIAASRDSSGRYQDYVSNTRIMAGVDFAYRDLSVSLGFRTRLYANDARLYGKSKAGSLSMRYTHKKWAFEGKYGGYSGFADATKADSVRKEFPFRKDLNAYIVTLNTIYTFRAHKFSYGAAFNYSYRQLKSSWSPLLMGHIYGARFNAHTSVLDTLFTQPIRKTSIFNKSNTYAIGIGPGIGGTAVLFKRFFVTGFLCIGGDLQFNKLTKNRSRVYESTTANPFANFRCALGYNVNRFFAAFTLKNEDLVFDMYKFNINHSYTIYTIELGYRFDAPKWLHHTYDIFAMRN